MIYIFINSITTLENISIKTVAGDKRVPVILKDVKNASVRAISANGKLLEPSDIVYQK